MSHPSAWLITDLDGIQPYPDEPGPHRLLSKLHIPQELEWIKAEMQTLFAEVKSA